MAGQGLHPVRWNAMRITAADELVVTFPASRSGAVHRVVVDYGDDVVTITVYFGPGSGADNPTPGQMEAVVSLPGPLAHRAVRDGARAIFKG